MRSPGSSTSASGDAGGALGAALFVWYQLLENERVPVRPDGQTASYLGPAPSSDEVAVFLKGKGAVSHHYPDPDELAAAIADLLSSEKVVGLVQGRMEFGPRALGARSILGDARSREMQKVMNLKIKFRESFRPFAPSVLRERVSDYFETRPEEESPYMLLVADVRPEHRTDCVGELDAAQGLAKLPILRSDVPAITHVDFSARIQTVDRERHGLYYRILKQFEAKTGCPVIINTSFNVRGEPIVCTPEDAYRCFMATNMDALVLEDRILLKEEQPGASEIRLDEYLATFALD